MLVQTDSWWKCSIKCDQRSGQKAPMKTNNAMISTNIII